MTETVQPAVTGPVEPPGMQHTQGPWTAYGCLVMADADCEYHQVADCEPNHSCRAMDEAAANAALIAAAPDLLMALQMLYAEAADYIRLNNLGGMDNHCMRLARAALARAGAA